MLGAGLAPGCLHLAPSPSLALHCEINSTDYALLDPTDHFDGTEEGLKHLHYVIGNKVVPLDQLRAGNYVAGLWEKVLGDNAPPLVDVQAVRQ